MRDEPKLPPVTELGMLSLALILAGGIYQSSHLPAKVSLTAPVILLVASVVVMAGSLLWLASIKTFAWLRFWQIARWSLLAYVITAGLIGYVFIRNNLTGGDLVVLIASLVVYAIEIPTLTGFTVARYAAPAQR